MRRDDNPKNRFESRELEWADDAPPPYALLEVIEEQAKTIVNEIKSPDLQFDFSVNPYRGCFHGCAYCYARPSHQYWGYGAGTDFDRKIIVKVNAVELLRERFERKDWEGKPITFSGNTDCYQPLEASQRLTRGCLEVCAEYRNPVAIITKNALVQRDLDVLCELNEHASLRVYLSIPFADDAMARKIEPGASSPTKRFAALETLSRAGIETGLAIAPIIVGLNDKDIPELLRRGRDAGVKHAFRVALRLPAEVLPVFESRLQEAYPQSFGKVMSAVMQIRRGKKNESQFGERMRGHGPRWQVIDDLFALHCDRLGLNHDWNMRPAPERTFRRPERAGGQLALF
jgi:DNA repair photolyase